MQTLFTIRDAVGDDLPTMDHYANLEGMDALPGVENCLVAVSSSDEVVGFIRIDMDGDVCYVNPVVVYRTWRGHGVGEALMERATAGHDDVRLVARGVSVGFYERLGFTEIPWEQISFDHTEECDGCPLFGECGPVPMRRLSRKG